MKRSFRCSICNKVSTPEIETFPGDYKSDFFVEDPKDKNNFICGECREIIDQTNAEFYYEEV